MSKINIFLPDARVAKLVDALDLGSSVSRRGGSSPPSRTKVGNVERPLKAGD